MSGLRCAVGGWAATAMLVLASAGPLTAEPIAVTVTNQSEPVLCAEKDNVAVAFASPSVKRFRIEAAHPAYLLGLQQDSIAADWTDCDMTGDPVFRSDVAVPTRKTLYERPDLWVVGWTLPTFWRPSKATVTIGETVHAGLHLVQVWMIRPMGGEEVLVFYPQDGYWRLRPKAPTGRDLTAFGSSVLIGPVTDAGRPIVDLDDIAFDPEAKAFALSFAGGGRAEVTMSEVSDRRHVLDVTLTDVDRSKPFAMVRSMYVTAFNNDAAAIAVRPEAEPNSGKGWSEAPILDFKSADATAAWIGRRTISRHNSSSPDTVLDGFQSD